MALPNLSSLSLRCIEVNALGDDDESEGEEAREDPLTKILREARERLEKKLREEDQRQGKHTGKRKAPQPRVPTTPQSRPAPSPTPDQTPAPPPVPGPSSSSDGFVPKKRLLMQTPPWRAENMLDFSFENPLDGKFKDLPVVKQLLKDYPYLVKQVGTSYCHYGFDYRKRTVFVSSLPNFDPTPPCPDFKCYWVASGLSHPGTVLACGSAQKNSLPPRLIDGLIDSWRKRHEGKATAYLLVDVFSGWGSVKARAAEKKSMGQWLDLRTYSNDLVQRDHTDVTLDMSADSTWTPAALLTFAVDKHWPEDTKARSSHPGGVIGWLNQQKIAVLFHCSTPCDTYSLVGLKSHRVGKTLEPKTQMARDHDAMNAKLIDYFRMTALSPLPTRSATSQS